MNLVLKNLLVLAASTAVIKTLHKENPTAEKRMDPNLPDFKGVVEVKHAIGGRIRFFIPMLVHNEEAAALLQNEIRKIKAVTQIQVNVLTGSLLLYYKKEVLEPHLLMAIVIKLLGMEEEVSRKPVPALGKEMKNLKDAINQAIYSKSNGKLDGSSLLVLLLLASAAYKLYTGTGSKVGPITCLMWSLSYID